jgi:formylglycine-generating enzyme required for sulfatase activity
MKQSAWIIALSAVLTAGSASAQNPTIAELERQLQAKEAEQAAQRRRAAEAAEARRRAEAEAEEAPRRAEAEAEEARRRAEAEAEAARTRPGTVFRDALTSGGEGPAMVILPPGRFEQGSPSYEGDRQADEGPVREVRIGTVALGQREVTRGEFRRFIEATGYRTDAERNTAVPTMPGSHQGCFAFQGGSSLGWKAGTSWRDPGFAQGDDHPVVCVSWNDAQAYVEWLSRETGRAYRLPSESEQEYAIRAGTTTPWPWGSSGDTGCTQANYGDASLKARVPDWLLPTAGCQDGHAFTAPVGSFAANAFGLQDTSGNVWEWAQDCWNESYAGAPTDGSAWQSGDCGRRVLRGGSWGGNPAGLRSANRYGDHSANRVANVGFRLARTL